MKYFSIQKTVIFFFACLLFGCIKEDSDDCTVKKESFETKIAFQCISDSADIFKQEITLNSTLAKGGSVALYVYDKATGNLVIEQNVPNNTLKGFQGTTLSLEPGVYEIRCWANMDAYSVIYDEDKLSTARLSNKKYYPNQEVVTSDDPLYYGAAMLTVPLKGFNPETVADTINFRTAHMRFNIEFAGGNNITPKIEIKNLEPEFDFNMQKIDKTTSYFPEIKLGTSLRSTVLKAEFNILRTAYRNSNISYDNTNNIEIRITDSKTDSLMHTVNLKDWMNTYGIKINASNDNNILSIPDSLQGTTSGVASLPPIVIDITGPSGPPTDTIPDPPTPPTDTIPTPPDTIPDPPTPPTDTIPTPPDTIPNPPVDPDPPVDPLPPAPDVDKQGLLFHLYRDNCQDNDIFANVIQSVNLYVYEKESGNQINIAKDVLTSSDLSSFLGYRFALPPINSADTTTKEYEIRCWGNVGTNTAIKNQHHLVSAGLSHTNYSLGEIRTNDELYFGKASVKVKSNYTYVTENIDFKIAHTKFEIKVIGMDTIPEITVSGLPASYDFYMADQQWLSKDYNLKPTTAASDTIFSFKSLRLTNQSKDNVEIKITDGKNPAITETIRLKDETIYINENKCYDYIHINSSSSGSNTIRITITKVGNTIVALVSS